MYTDISKKERKRLKEIVANGNSAPRCTTADIESNSGEEMSPAHYETRARESFVPGKSSSSGREKKLFIGAEMRHKPLRLLRLMLP